MQLGDCVLLAGAHLRGLRARARARAAHADGGAQTFQVLERDELMRCPFCEALYDSVALQRQGGVTDLHSARCLYCSYRPLAVSSMGEVAAHAQAMGVLQ